jgi:hypothetical protein
MGQVCEWRERWEQRHLEACPDWTPDYEERWYSYGDCRIAGQVEALPDGLGRMPLCRRLMLAVVEPAGDGWRVVRRQGPFGDDQCHRGIKKMAWRDLDGDGTREVVLETQHGDIDSFEFGQDWIDWDTSLHVIWPDHAFSLPLGHYESIVCSDRRAARYEFRQDGAVLHFEHGAFTCHASCGRGSEAWPAEGEETDSLQELVVEDLRWDAGRRGWYP